MLKLATKEDLSSIVTFCENDLLGTRIACYCMAYGFEYDFLRIWIEEADGNIQTVLAKFYDCITLKTDAETTEEIAEFINMIGFSSLETNLMTCQKLNMQPSSVKKSYIFDGTAESSDADDLGEEYYKELYSLISRNIPDSFSETKEAYLSFLSDFSYRSRRGLARCKGIIKDSILVSSVLTSAETEKAALISGVASDISVRGMGFGKKTVLTMVNELTNEGKTVFVTALNESAQGFYEKLGFKYHDDIAIVL